MGLNTTPATVIPGQTGTAALWNTEVRDALTGIQSTWTSWTPTIASGVTLGNGTFTGSRYQQIGKSIDCEFLFTLGTTSAITAAPVFQFPVAVSTTYASLQAIGSGILSDTSVGVTGRYPASVFLNNTFFGGFGSFSLVTNGGNVSATIPFTWANTDVLSFFLRYEAA